MKTDSKIVTYEQLAKRAKSLKKQGKKLVLTTGCFDILHLGHIVHFNYCKSCGDYLAISVGSDATVRSLKGPDRPINNETFRARMIAALGCVDFVVISREMGKMDHNELVELVKPDIYVVPGTDTMVKEKKKLVMENKGQFIACRRVPPDKIKGGISTTKIAKKLESE